MTTTGDPVPPRRPGPIDDVAWPDTLTARVVAPGERPLVHGYDVEQDLATHYGIAHATLLALTGELPSDDQARAFEVATAFLSPSPVNEAPSHAALIVHVCNVLTSALVATVALALGEQARVLVAEHASWLRRLDAGAVGPADAGEWAASGAAERGSVERLRRALQAAGLTVPTLDLGVARTPALLAVLHFAGLRRIDRIEAAIVMARLPTAIAEGLACTHSYKDYAVELPPVRYTEEP
jgi:hypothetical protein